MEVPDERTKLPAADVPPNRERSQMHPYLKSIKAVPAGAGIILAALLIPLQLSGQNGQLPHSSVDQTKSSVSTPVNKTPQTGDDIPCVPSAANTASVKYTTPATPVQKHHVDLHWTASISPEVREYKVHRCTPGGLCSPATSVIKSVNGTSYSDETVQSRQAYCYFVTAFVKGPRGSDSAPSNILYVVIPSP